MATAISKLAVMLTANTAGFTSGMKSAVAPLKSFGSQVGSIGKKVIGLGGALAALAAGAGMTALVKGSMESIDATAKLSDRLGITTEAMTGLQHAADLSGVSSEALTGGIEKMLKTLGEAATGGSAAGAAFAKLGLDANQLVNAAPDEAFKAIADGLLAIQNPAERASAAMAIFGKSGQALLPLMLSGADGIAAAQAEAEKLGLTFSRVDAAKVEAANDAMSRLKAVFVGVARTLAIQLAPFIDAAATKLAEMGMSGEGMGGKVVDAFEWILTAVAQAGNVFDGFKIVLKSLQLTFAWCFKQGVNGALGMAQAITWVVNKSIEGINWLIRQMNKLPEVNIPEIEMRLAVDRTLADALMEGQDELIGQLADEIRELSKFDGAERVTAFFDDLRAKADANAKAVAENAEKMRGAAMDTDDWAEKLQQAEQNAAKVTDTLADLKAQVERFGMSDSQTKLADLAALGATPEQLEQAKQALAQLDALNEAKKKSEDLQQRAKSIIESVATPTEKYDQQIGELSELLNAGLISWEQYGRAVRSAREELEQSTKVEPADAPELIRAGSAQAMKLAFESRGMQRLTRDDLGKKQLARTEDTNRLLGRIEQKIGVVGADVTTVDI